MGGEMRTCVTGFHVSVLAQVVCPRRQTIEESGAEPLKYCCLTTAAARLHQLTAALRLHDADKREECYIKGQHAIWQSAPLLRSTEWSHETQRGFPSKTRLLGFFFFPFWWNFKLSMHISTQKECSQSPRLLTALFLFFFLSDALFQRHFFILKRNKLTPN